MQNEQEKLLNQIISIDESMKTVTTVDFGIGKKLLFVTINSSTYMRALALTQTPDQNIHAEPETTGWIDEFEGGAVLLDIGANVGTFSVYAAVVKKARVYAFEPSSPNFFLLNRNIQLNNINGLVTPFPIALSDESKIDSFICQAWKSAAAETRRARTRIGYCRNELRRSSKVR